MIDNISRHAILQSTRYTASLLVFIKTINNLSLALAAFCSVFISFTSSGGDELQANHTHAKRAKAIKQYYGYRIQSQ